MSRLDLPFLKDQQKTRVSEEVAQKILRALDPSPGFIHRTVSLLQTTDNVCPGCGSFSIVHEEGCKKCYSCGYSEC